MGNADVFALVGWAEPFGVVFLEAMASGLPVVLSEDAGIAECLEDGKTALFTLPRNQASVEQALSRCLREPELRASIGEAGRAIYIKTFQWKSIIREYLKIMKSTTG